MSFNDNPNNPYGHGANPRYQQERQRHYENANQQAVYGKSFEQITQEKNNRDRLANKKTSGLMNAITTPWAKSEHQYNDAIKSSEDVYKREMAELNANDRRIEDQRDQQNKAQRAQEMRNENIRAYNKKQQEIREQKIRQQRNEQGVKEYNKKKSSENKPGIN